ncbi:MAG: MFS transporter [Acidobacteriota bacterium]
MLKSPDREPLLTGPFIRLWTFGFITFFSAFQLLPTIPFRIMNLGGSKAEAGFFLAIYTYASALSAPITGTIADHVGRRILLIGTSCAFIVFSLLYGVVTWLPLLLLIACIHGILWSSILASGAAIITELIPVSRRTEGMAYWGMASTAAVATAPVVGLAVYSKGWMTLCLEMSALSVVMVILALRIRGGTGRSHEPFPAASQLVDWRVLAAACSLFVISYGYGGVTSYVAVLSMERHIVPRSLYFTVFAITILISRIFTAPLGDRLGPRALLYPSLAILPFSLAMLAWSHDRTMIVSSAILFGLGFGSAYPSFATFVLARSDPARRAATFGSIILAFDTGIGTGSFLTGFVAEHGSFAAAFLVAAILSTTAIPIFVYTSRFLVEPTPSPM